MTPELGAVVLAGGTAARLGGADKASIELGGMTLLERALAALEAIREVVVVGEEVRTSRPVTFTREDPAGGGPAAGLLAGLRAFPRRPERVVALAVDLPLVTSQTVERLLAPGGDGALLMDGDGRRQFLCAVYDTHALTRTERDEHGLSMRALLEGLDLVEVPVVDDESHDVDSWDDLRVLRERLGS